MGSYNTMAEMRIDPRLNSRVQSCVIEQAQQHPTSEFTEAIKLSATTVGPLFMTLIHTDPAMSDAYEAKGEDSVTDEMILVGVQENWHEVENLWRKQNGLDPLPPPGVVPPEPEVSDIDPATGPRVGGVNLTIWGVALSGATAVTINMIACTSVTVVSDTQVTAVTPGLIKGSYPVIVTVDGTDVIGPNYDPV